MWTMPFRTREPATNAMSWDKAHGTVQRDPYREKRVRLRVPTRFRSVSVQNPVPTRRIPLSQIQIVLMHDIGLRDTPEGRHTGAQINRRIQETTHAHSGWHH